MGRTVLCVSGFRGLSRRGALYLRTVLKMLRSGGAVLLLVPGLLALPFFQSSAHAATVSDNFNRSNGGLGSNWTTVSGTTAPQIVNNTAQPGSAGTLNSAYWSANTFGGNQYAAASFPNSSGTNYGPGIAVRLSNSKGYILWYGNSASTVSIWRMDNSASWSQLKTSAKLTVASTDVWQLQAVGSTLTGYQNGKQVVTTTDTQYTTGAPGIWMYYATNQIANWSGGDVATAGEIDLVHAARGGAVEVSYEIVATCSTCHGNGDAYAPSRAAGVLTGGSARAELGAGGMDPWLLHGPLPHRRADAVRAALARAGRAGALGRHRDGVDVVWRHGRRRAFG